MMSKTTHKQQREYRNVTNYDLRTKRSLIYFINNIGSTFKTLLFVIKIIKHLQKGKITFLFWFTRSRLARHAHAIICMARARQPCFSGLFSCLYATDSSTNLTRSSTNRLEFHSTGHPNIPLFICSGKACAVSMCTFGEHFHWFGFGKITQNSVTAWHSINAATFDPISGKLFYVSIHFYYCYVRLHCDCLCQFRAFVGHRCNCRRYLIANSYFIWFEFTKI